MLVAVVHKATSCCNLNPTSQASQPTACHPWPFCLGCKSALFKWKSKHFFPLTMPVFIFWPTKNWLKWYHCTIYALSLRSPLTPEPALPSVPGTPLQDTDLSASGGLWFFTLLKMHVFNTSCHLIMIHKYSHTVHTHTDITKKICEMLQLLCYCKKTAKNGLSIHFHSYGRGCYNKCMDEYIKYILLNYIKISLLVFVMESFHEYMICCPLLQD